MKIEKSDHVTMINFSNPMMCISSAILGGGINKNVISVANVTLSTDRYVPVSFMPDYCREIIKSFKCNPDSSVALLTSVPQKYLGQSADGKCIITAGLGNACELGPHRVWDEKNDEMIDYLPGTINCILVLDDCLSSSALVEIYGIVKLAIAEIVSIWSTYTGHMSFVGTPTDCVAVLCPNREQVDLHFTGIGTKIGADTVYLVRDALVNAISHRYAGFESYYNAGLKSDLNVS